MIRLLAISTCLFSVSAFAAEPEHGRAADTTDVPVVQVSTEPAPGNVRIASVYLSQELVNHQLKDKLSSDLIRELSVDFEPNRGLIIARGVLRIPVEEIRALNLEEGLGDFRFQLTIQPRATKHGHLMLVFPLNETYLYPDGSNEMKDRIVVPVQFLSIALASARGYLAALSGDFSGFDRKAAELREKIKKLDAQIAKAKDADERDRLKTDREADELQLAAVPVERKQMEDVAKEASGVLAFSGEKELNLSDELKAHRNALLFRIRLGQLLPFLPQTQLGAVRLLQSKSTAEKYLAVDVDLPSDGTIPKAPGKPQRRPPSGKPPEVVLRLNQAIFENETLSSAEKQDLGDKIKNLKMEMHDDGLHITGAWKSPLLVHIPFDAIVDFNWVSPDVFDIEVRKLKIAFVELRPLTLLLLDSIKARLDRTFKGMLYFEYVGREKDGARGIRVTVDMHHLLPAFPGMRLIDVETKDYELLLKAGRI